MRDFLAYLYALKLRAGFRAFLQLAGFLGTPILSVVVMAIGYRPNRNQRWALVAVELAVIVVLLLFSGFVAWNGERERGDKAIAALNARWPRLGESQRAQVAKMLEPFSGFPEILIFRNETADCRDFAADLGVAMELAMPNARSPINPTRAPRHLPSGIVILARPNDDRGAKIQAALKAVAKIDARLSTQADIQFQIQVGSRDYNT